MIEIRCMVEVVQLPDSPVKRAMANMAALCQVDNDNLAVQMEKDFDYALGGYWYIFEETDNHRNLRISQESTFDLLSDRWRNCDAATLEEGCFCVFWAFNNAGGPCMFIPDQPWLDPALRDWLQAQVAATEAEVSFANKQEEI
ncbi:hypothetical protein KP003_02910 [Geomonas nitrogeniifigens]|uniref:hypothetical protein n=1 Tax=Geomonas diazotrophica TaxID=2843197 RepID=UPI001C2B78DC|nr:hypothetical protein [Geomonas nitrogeniifigens]QXE87375.1 hypothetical protein KP003_02910 [Geomonas nitrogeniifigens]